MKEKSKNILKEGGINLSKVIITASAGILSGYPILGTGIATVLTETFFSIRGNLKLKRTENFIIEFSKYIKNINPNFDTEKIDSEDFGDFFEQLLKKVSETNSTIKLLGYKKLAANQVLKPISYNLIPKYLDLISNINDNHIIIIKHWFFEETRYKSLLKEFDLKGKFLKNQFESGIDKTNDSESYSDYQTRLLNYDEIDKENIRELIKVKRNKLIENFGVDEFDFWTFDLIKLGVLAHHTNLSSYNAESAFRSLYISPFGKKVFEYIFEEI
tara:strand:+ start:1271 stop:2086 length:816 start_codon:yes stop_codon:yes gene_type:complete